ncbi:MAG: type VI secretion system protein TssR [Saprospiraceae bacterium]
MKRIYILIWVILLLSIHVAYSQDYKRILTRPAQFENPKDLYGEDMSMNNEMERFIFSDRGSSNTRWEVLSDRKNNILYDKPDGSPKAIKMNFLDKAYVVEKQGNWLHLIKGDPYIISNGVNILKDRVEELGWIQRDKLILWDKALKDPYTGIDRKVVMMNMGYEGAREVVQSSLGEVVQSGIGDTIPMYASPDGRYPKEGQLIYSFYYVVKKENNHYLVARDYEGLTGLSANSILGWVSKFRAAQWDNRLALEPNIYEDAFIERVNYPSFQAAHYDDPEQARDHKLTGHRQDRGLMVVHDPAASLPVSKWPTHIIKKTNSDTKVEEKLQIKRFPGGVLRSPVLEIDRASGDYYRTAVVDEIRIRDVLDLRQVGQMDESSYAQQAKVAEKYKEASKTWNVVFLIEGTYDMLPYRDEVLGVIDNFGKYIDALGNGKLILRTGAVVYRDVADEAEGRLIEVVPKGTVQQTRNALANIRFSNTDPADDRVAALEYGLEQVLYAGVFSNDQVNVIVHLGQGGDLQQDRGRKSSSKGHKALLTADRREALFKGFGDYQIHMLSMQIRNTGGLDGGRFLSAMQNIILTTAQNGMIEARSFAKQKLNFTLSANPHMIDPVESPYAEGRSCRLLLEDATSVGVVYSPGTNQQVSSSQIRDEVKYFLDQTYEYDRNSRKAVDDVMAGGRALQDVPHQFQQVVVDQVRKHLAGFMSESQLKLIKDLKFRLMLPSYVPVDIKGMKYPLFSYVVLLNEDELEKTIDRLTDLASVYTKPNLREALFNTLYQQCDEVYLGNLSVREAKNLTKREFDQIISGIQGKGITLPGPENWKLGDILNDKKGGVSEGEILAFSERIISNLSILRDQIKNADYPYSFTRGDHTYYWVPIEFTL